MVRVAGIQIAPIFLNSKKTWEKLSDYIRESHDGFTDLADSLYRSFAEKHILQAIRDTHQYFKDTGISKRRFLEMLHGYILGLEDFKPMWLILIAEADIRIAAGGTDIVHIDAMLCKMVS